MELLAAEQDRMRQQFYRMRADVSSRIEHVGELLQRLQQTQQVELAWRHNRHRQAGEEGGQAQGGAGVWGSLFSLA